MFNIFKAKIKPVEYSNEYIIKNPALCRLRWVYPIVNFGQQAVRQCCRTPMMKVSAEEVEIYKDQIFLNHPNHQERRSEMLKGIKHPECNTCWQLESDQVPSPRENFNSKEQFNFLTSQDTGQNPTTSYRPWMMDIELSNLCDLKCMYCNRSFSSSWASEDVKLNKISLEDLKKETPVKSENFEKYFWQWFDQVKDGIVHLNFIGGEPTINPQYYRFLEGIKKAYQYQVRRELSLVTVSNFNASPEQFEKFVNTIADMTEYFNVDIDASQETYGERSEFIRYGLKWENWERNVHTILSRNLNHFTLGIQGALNILSLKTASDFFDKIADIRDQYNTPVYLKTNIISFPSYMSPLIGTEDMAEDLRKAASVVKKRIRPEFESQKDRYKNFNWENYSHFLLNLAQSISNKQKDIKSVTKERAQFYQWVNDYEKNRSVQFLETFPEYREFYELCKLADQQ